MIPPGLATSPDELPRLWGTALSTGDVDAAWSLYVRDAVLLPWHLPAVRGGELLAALCWLAELRLPVRVGAVRASLAGHQALLAGRWSISGLDGGGSPVALSAEVTALARRDGPPGPGARWQIYLERWTESR